MGVMDPLILLSFDVEEFDISLEYGQPIPESQQEEVSAQGLVALLELLDHLDMAATFFTTAHFALNQKSLIQGIASRHEIASHGFTHSQFEDIDLIRSRLVLQGISGQPVIGFRRPRMQATSGRLIQAAGYEYDSSENPIWLPGRYNNFFKPRMAHLEGSLLIIPASAVPFVRFPLFWLSFKNFPLELIQAASWLTLQNDHYLNIYFHSWEFADLSNYSLPGFVKHFNGERMLERLEGYLRWLKRHGRSVTFSEYNSRFRHAHARAPGSASALCTMPKDSTDV